VFRIFCAIVACLAIVATPAAAETGDSAPIRPFEGLSVGEIAGPTAPEEYPFQHESLGPNQRMSQVSDQEIVVEYVEPPVVSYSLRAPLEHDAVGAAVPTTIALTEDEAGPVITLTVHFRAGNPAAGGSPFDFPITGGAGWEGGYRITSVELNEPKPPPGEPAPSPAPPSCTVPSLRGFGLVAVKKLLRGADCAIGQVRLAHGATKGKGKVVKQFEPVGTQLEAGAPVAVKLSSR
jgi:hypothetical protein